MYGEILDCAFQWTSGSGVLDPPLWARLRGLVDTAADEWRTPDHGIWEVRTPGRPFTYSAALCQVALDRGVRLVERTGLPGNVAHWRATADQVCEAILEQAWDSRW